MKNRQRSSAAGLKLFRPGSTYFFFAGAFAGAAFAAGLASFFGFFASLDGFAAPFAMIRSSRFDGERSESGELWKGNSVLAW
jgi:hypothetical protein